MRKNLFWKISLLALLLINQVYGDTKHQIGTLSESSCWFENLESLKIASFNDKSVYSGSRTQIESELETLLFLTLAKGENNKIKDLDLSLHCGGYGGSLVAKIETEANTFCMWTRFEKGKLSVRSLGAINGSKKNGSELCDGHKWGEFIVGVNSEEFISELQTTKWSSIIKAITPISTKMYKIILIDEYQFRENEVIDLLEENFSGRKVIRFIEFNNYQHPVGEFVHLEK